MDKYKLYSINQLFELIRHGRADVSNRACREVVRRIEAEKVKPHQHKVVCPECETLFSVSFTEVQLSVPHGQSCACDKCLHKADSTFKPATK